MLRVYTLRHSWSLLVITLVIYLTLEFTISQYVSTLRYLAIYSLLWFSFSISLTSLRGSKYSSPRPSGSLFIVLSILMGIFQVLLLVLIGVAFAGFGYSPYSHEPTGVMLNILLFFLPVIAFELLRRLILRSSRNLKPSLIVATTMVTVLLSLHIFNMAHVVKNTSYLMEFLGTLVMPLLAENVMATYLLIRGGVSSSISYRLTLASFEYFSPILPRLSWIMKSFIYSAGSIMNFIIVEGISSSSRRREGIPLSLLIPTLLIALTIWFSLGFLGIYPTVIVSKSMSPLIEPGDLVVVLKVPYCKIHVGDIIHFWDGQQFIVHRVIDIRVIGSYKFFITKGDANEAPDPDPVPQTSVLGKMILVIPKIGWLSILVKRLIYEGYLIVKDNIKLSLITLLSIMILLAYVSKKRRKRYLIRRLRERKMKLMLR